MKKISIPVFTIVAATAFACGALDDATSETTATDIAEITPAQARRCARLASAGLPQPWYCGGFEAALSPELAEACPDNQWVGLELTGSGICPPPSSAPSTGIWNVAAPFAGTPPLDRFCIYRWEPALPGAVPNLSTLPNSPDLRLERDCEVVAPNTRLPDGAWQPLETGYLEQMDVPTVVGLPYQRTTEVAVVDTSLTRSGVGSGESLHGEAMGGIVERLTCLDPSVGGSCGAAVSMQLALPRIDTETYGPRGGFYGSQAELAIAMYLVIERWRTSPTWLPGDHIILNLSLGWNAAYGGEPGPDMRLPARLAYLVAQYASCRGALLIASAGNRSTDDSSGALYPAAWETVPRICTSAPPSAYDPLVHAVGGVDGRDEILALSRVDSQPRIAAPASQVNVERSSPAGVPTPVLSGTSIAAAGVSAIAANIWSLQPSLQPWQVMQAVYATGMPVGGTADFGFDGRLQNRRRVSVCRALTLACLNLQCPPIPSCENRPAGVDATADFAAAIPFAYPQLTGLENAGPGNSVTDPTDRDPYRAPWVVPQPGDDVCPLCGIVGVTLYGQIDPEIAQNATIDAMTMVLTDVENNGYEIPIFIDDPNEPFAIEFEELAGVELIKGKIELTTNEEGEETVRVSELFIK